MKTINLVAGEFYRNHDGTHSLNEKGFAVKLETDVSVEIEDHKYDAVWAQIQEDRTIRGVDPETGLPIG